MKQLPAEIWHKILQLLAEKDKLACLLVSTYWNKSIRPHLFNHIKIRNDIDLADAIFYFETYSELAGNVLHLEIKMCENIILSLPRIQQLFRNLEKLSWFSDKELQLTRYPPQYFRVLDPWNDLKELHISETLSYDQCSLFELIIRRGLCPNLTKLSLEILDIIREGNRFTRNLERCASSVEMMANATQLSHLEITSFEGSLKLLGFLHKKLPKLDSLKLHDLRLHDYSVPIGPLETVQLADLHLDPGLSIDPLLLFDYIVRKYTGLKSLQIIIDRATSSVCHVLPAAELEIMILPLFARCPQLTYYDQCYFKFTPTIANEMDLCGIQLKTIKLYVDQKIVKSQCTALGDSNQRKFVNHVFLRLLNSIPEENESFDQTLDAHMISQALESLANLTNMTKLTLQSNDNLLCYKEFPIFLNKLPNS